jgi:hypothetical protein
MVVLAKLQSSSEGISSLPQLGRFLLRFEKTPGALPTLPRKLLLNSLLARVPSSSDEFPPSSLADMEPPRLSVDWDETTGAKWENRRLPERQVPSGNAYFGML